MTKTNTKHTPQAVYLKDYSPPSHAVEYVHFTFQIFESHTLVTQKARYVRQGTKRSDLTLNKGKDVDLVSVSINGIVTKSYDLSDDHLRLHCPGDSFDVEIVVKIDPDTNTALEGLYRSGGNYTTQCESEGFRNITCWMDRPDVMTVYTVRIEADEATCPVLLSNGNCIEKGSLDGGRHYAVWQDPHKKAGHLFALVAGDLVYTEDFFITMNERKVTLRIFTKKGTLHMVDYAMKALKKSMKWDEDIYGREYDLDIFHIVVIEDFNMGGMENKSLNIFNSIIWVDPETATDENYRYCLRVVGHEYFHNWAGNRVNCRDWFQISLKEGFVCMRENQFAADIGDAVDERIKDVEFLKDMQFAEDASPFAHPIQPDHYIEMNNMYTVTVYEKGAEVIRMMHTILGDDMYRKGTDLYFSRHDGQAVTCDDFLKAMQDASANKHMDQFKLWYSQAGTPRVTANSAYDAATKKLKITFTQSIPDTPGQTNKKPMVIPIKTGVMDKNGKELAESVLILTKDKQDFVFDDIAEEPVISYLRGFSAPVILDTDQTTEDYLFLLRHDTDGFNRWEAGQRLMMDALSSSCPLTPFTDALRESIHALKDDNKALLVRLLTLPKDSVIANAQKIIDPDAIAAAKSKLEKSIAVALDEDFDMLYGLCAPDAEFSTSPESMAKRAMRNLILKYKLAVNEAQAIRMAYDQFQNAITMTEKLGALSILVETDRPEREHALISFYDDYKDHALVVDKWFSVQACAGRHDTPARVRDLMKHKDFTLANPNRVRALIGAFAMRNQKAFHVLSGEGYEILADVIIALNDTNPQIASRLFTPLRGWASFTANRQKLMKAELKRILAIDNLSPDVFEVVSKCLKG